MRNYRQRKTIQTHLGKYTQVTEHRKYQVLHNDGDTLYLSDNRQAIEQKYEGLQIGRSQVNLANTQFVTRGEATTSTGIVKCIVGDTQDIINDDLTASVRSVSMVSGRDKGVNNKKAQGELRRRNHENRALSFGLSGSKADHKRKHASK